MQINFTLGKPGAGAVKGLPGVTSVVVPKPMPSSINSFSIPTATPAAAASSSKSKSSRPATTVKTEAEGEDTAVVGKRRATQVDYRSLDAGAPPIPVRKSGGAPAGGAAFTGPPPSSMSMNPPASSLGPQIPVSQKNKPKKTMPSGPVAPANKPKGTVPAASAATAPKKTGPPRLSPMPAQFFSNGPPFVSMDFKYPEDLMPKRPVVAPFDPMVHDPKLEEKKQQLARVEQELADLVALEGLRAREKEAIGKHFKAKAVKARKLQLELEKRQNPVYEVAAQRVAEMKGSGQSFPSSTHKRPLHKSRNDFDYEDEYDEDDIPISTQRKAVRSSLTAAGGSAPKKAKAPSKRSIPQTLPPWLQKCIRLIDDLMALPQAVYFVRPVDPELDGIVDYFDVISSPMDLGTMRTKCETSAYADVDEVLADFEQIYQNCVTYNGIESPVTADCKALQKVWGSRVPRIRGDDVGGGAAAESKRSSRAPRSSAGRSGKASAAPKAPVLKDLTWPEKELLMGYIGALPPEQLSNVVQIVGEVRALDGGDQEGGEVELDFGELPTVTLRKLQDFVHAYRRENGLEVAAPAAPAEDDVVLADDEQQQQQQQPTAAAAAAASFSPPDPSPKPKKQRSQKSVKKEETAPRPTGRMQPPKTQEDLKLLAEKTKENTESALQELKNELKRMAGKVVDTDHVQLNSSGLVQAANEYSLDPAVLVQHLENSDDSVSSDTVSSDEEEDDAKKSSATTTRTDPANVHIIAVADQGADVVIEDTSGWRQLDDSKNAAAPPQDQGGAAAVVADDGLWEEFASKDAQQMELAKARKEHEEKLKRERELKEEELRKLEKEKRLKQEEEDRRKREEKEREEREAQRLREEERLARKREREEDEPRVDLTEQQRLMADFERN
jgi:hypothetical protein